jgi:hypothetical protein
MLRLIDEFVLNNKTGLGNEAVDGFYFDDSWHKAPATAPPGAAWHSCDNSPTGGATEEEKHCSIDMGRRPLFVDSLSISPFFCFCPNPLSGHAISQPYLPNFLPLL